ncbi:ZrgA family zinc uptake protein [Aliagarivorans taiwanensis]|uniref:ZrgA family zinc uptake protein n=1 Tax=Aliagarivorans taiwanensis TaxID=561966 RepID=UPI000416DA95|nr:DUF2796 domain-containing protein [Aliagarivorans taiwanensis]
MKLTTIAAISAALFSAASVAAGHGAHQHGVAELLLASEGDELELQFHSPADNLVGFEHAPQNAEQRVAIERAMTLLANPATLGLPAAAECELEKVEAEWGELTIAAAEHDHHDGHDHHDHDDHDHHDHDKHDDHGHHDHDKHDDHDHHDHDKHDDHDHEHGHADVAYHYHLHCHHPEKLNGLDLQLFDHFPSLQRLNVQVATESGQTQVELTPQQTRLAL